MNKVMPIHDEEVLRKELYRVDSVDMETVRQICKEKHYLHRVPSIVASYGLYRGDLLMGILTYGIPPSPQLMKICGEDNKKAVLELNRLWCFDESPKNSESFLIGQSMKLLKKDKPDIKIIISFADTRENHLGYIYQATNWHFTGWSIPGGGSIVINGKEFHPKNLNNKYNTSDLNKLKVILDTEDIVYRPRSKKCRYVKFIGDKRENKILKKLCKYEIQDSYPKTLPTETEYKTNKQKLLDKEAEEM